jgi:hypothetical protein
VISVAVLLPISPVLPGVVPAAVALVIAGAVAIEKAKGVRKFTVLLLISAVIAASVARVISRAVATEKAKGVRKLVGPGYA